MANGNVSLAQNTWTKIAASGLSAVSWQVKGDGSVYIAATSADSAPAGDVDEWPRYAQGQGEVAIDVTTMFSGVSGAAHLWAYSPGKANEIWRSHA